MRLYPPPAPSLPRPRYTLGTVVRGNGYEPKVISLCLCPYFYGDLGKHLYKSGSLGRPVGVMLSVLQPARSVAVATMATDASRARTDGRFSNSAQAKY
jgi:hypothetical protein